HFVIGPLGAPDAAAHPGFHVDRDAFLEPAWHAHARGGQVVVEDGLRVRVDRAYLAAQEPAPARVTRIPPIHGGCVYELVVVGREQALAAGRGTHGLEVRRDVQR